MAKGKLPKSIRKFIRAEKARIRRSATNAEERKRLIAELMKRYYPSRS